MNNYTSKKFQKFRKSVLFGMVALIKGKFFLDANILSQAEWHHIRRMKKRFLPIELGTFSNYPKFNLRVSVSPSCSHNTFFML